MGKIYSNVSVNGKELYTLFDSGSVNNYITEETVRNARLKPMELHRAFQVGLGGEVRNLTKAVHIDGEIEGNYFFLDAFVVSDLGIDTQTLKKVDFLFGAYEIQRWNIKLDMKNEKLDLSGFAKDFTEY